MCYTSALSETTVNYRINVFIHLKVTATRSYFRNSTVTKIDDTPPTHRRQRKALRLQKNNNKK